MHDMNRREAMKLGIGGAALTALPGMAIGPASAQVAQTLKGPLNVIIHCHTVGKAEDIQDEAETTTERRNSISRIVGGYQPQSRPWMVASGATSGPTCTNSLARSVDEISLYRSPRRQINAPAHRGEEFEEELEELAKLGVFVMFLPSYAPELNLIELLWKKIKYEWLPLDIYRNFQTLTEGLFEVLKGIGSKYRITFG